MNRFFLDNSNEVLNKQIISEQENLNVFHHMKNVLRVRKGQAIELVVDKKLFEASIDSVGSKQIEVENLKELKSHAEMPIDVTIVVSPIKGDRTEFMIQKATELGVKHIIFTHFKNSVAKIKDEKKLDRYRKVAQSAAEQSKRLIIPSIGFIDSIKDINTDKYDALTIAYEEVAKTGEKNKLREVLDSKPQSLITVFGPEGGFEPKEIAVLNDKGFSSMALGRRILRAETAPLYLLSVASFQSEMG